MRLMRVMSYVRSLTVQRAAQIMGIDEGVTSHSLAGLVRRKLVRVTVRTPGAGSWYSRKLAKPLCDRIMIASAERELWFSNIFSPGEQVVLRDLLNRLLANARQVSERDPPVV